MTTPGLSYVPNNPNSPWQIYLQQVDRVTPHLGHLARWVETLKRCKRVLAVDLDPECGTSRDFLGQELRRLPESLISFLTAPVTLPPFLHEPFAAAIFDVVMPYIQGTELVRYMQSEKRLMRIPVIMMTAEQNSRLSSDIHRRHAGAYDSNDSTC